MQNRPKTNKEKYFLLLKAAQESSKSAAKKYVEEFENLTRDFWSNDDLHARCALPFRNSLEDEKEDTNGLINRLIKEEKFIEANKLIAEQNGFGFVDAKEELEKEQQQEAQQQEAKEEAREDANNLIIKQNRLKLIEDEEWVEEQIKMGKFHKEFLYTKRFVYELFFENEKIPSPEKDKDKFFKEIEKMNNSDIMKIFNFNDLEELEKLLETNRKVFFDQIKRMPTQELVKILRCESVAFSLLPDPEEHKDMFVATMNAMCASEMLGILQPDGAALADNLHDDDTQYKTRVDAAIKAYQAKDVDKLQVRKNYNSNVNRQEKIRNEWAFNSDHKIIYRNPRQEGSLHPTPVTDKSTNKSYQECLGDQEGNPVVDALRMLMNRFCKMFNIPVTMFKKAGHDKIRHTVDKMIRPVI